MSNKTKIYFLENSFNYNANDLNDDKIAGSEKTLINISNELAKDDNLTIKVFNNTTTTSIINNVYWSNINNIDITDKPDFVIAMSDVNLFIKMNCHNNYLWSHSVQSIEKFIRKKQLVSFLRYKPIMILEGDYHFKTRNLITSLFGKKILRIAPDYDFINTNIDIKNIPPPNAIFTTKSDRNLNFLITAWHKIKSQLKNSKLYINPPHVLNDLEVKNDVILRIKGDKDQLIKDLLNSRLFITPGHKTEVFCLAAEEARELCIPIVTMGYGALYERVEHGKTGYIAQNNDEFVAYSVQVLNDDQTYLKFRKNLLKQKNIRNYSHVKEDLINILNNND